MNLNIAKQKYNTYLKYYNETSLKAAKRGLQIAPVIPFQIYINNILPEFSKGHTQSHNKPRDIARSQIKYKYSKKQAKGILNYFQKQQAKAQEDYNEALKFYNDKIEKLKKAAAIDEFLGFTEETEELPAPPKPPKFKKITAQYIREHGADELDEEMKIFYEETKIKYIEMGLTPTEAIKQARHEFSVKYYDGSE